MTEILEPLKDAGACSSTDMPAVGSVLDKQMAFDADYAKSSAEHTYMQISAWSG